MKIRYALIITGLVIGSASQAFSQRPVTVHVETESEQISRISRQIRSDLGVGITPFSIDAKVEIIPPTRAITSSPSPLSTCEVLMNIAAAAGLDLTNEQRAKRIYSNKEWKVLVACRKKKA